MPRRPRHERVGDTDVYWSSDLRYLSDVLMNADPNAFVTVWARLYGHNLGHPSQEGWRSWWVGDKNAYWSIHLTGPAGERNPGGPVQVQISRGAGTSRHRAGTFRGATAGDHARRTDEGGFYRAWQYQDAIRAERRRSTSSERSPADPPRSRGGAVLARAIRRIVNDGGFA